MKVRTIQKPTPPRRHMHTPVELYGRTRLGTAHERKVYPRIALRELQEQHKVRAARMS